MTPPRPAGAPSGASEATGPTFADAAGRWAGLAGALLGWRADAFWAATPAELAGVIRALAGDDAPAAAPPDAATIRRLLEEHPDG